ncbi:MAG: hypothetical protein J2P54_09395 [Bradyrhizobiaceae bacterium]|nr:hypothetical protein [Bradyrhizobiaceae bacterium]
MELTTISPTLPDLIRPWHDFYLLVGTASATLVGLMFVAASIGAQVFTEENRAAIEAFISPTVVHFSTALFTCIIATMPGHTGLEFILLLSVLGLAGLGYSARVWTQLIVRHKFSVDAIDRLFYAVIPGIGQLLVFLSGVMLLPLPAAGLDCLAIAILLLLLAGIRNAWDMTMWIVIRAPVAEPRSDNTPPSSGTQP